MKLFGAKTGLIKSDEVRREDGGGGGRFCASVCARKRRGAKVFAMAPSRYPRPSRAVRLITRNEAAELVTKSFYRN